MPPIAILWVPTFELVCSSSSGLTFTCVDMWGLLCVCVGSCVGELCGGTVWGAVWGELGGAVWCGGVV